MTLPKFSELCEQFYNYKHPETGEPAPLISKEVYDISKKHMDELDGAIVHSRDFEYDYFGFKTLEKVLSAQDERKDRRTPAAHVDARRGRHSRG